MKKIILIIIIFGSFFSTNSFSATKDQLLRDKILIDCYYFAWGVDQNKILPMMLPVHQGKFFNLSPNGFWTPRVLIDFKNNKVFSMNVSDKNLKNLIYKVKDEEEMPLVGKIQKGNFVSFELNTENYKNSMFDGGEVQNWSLNLDKLLTLSSYQSFEEITESLLNVLVITVTKPNKKFKFNRYTNMDFKSKETEIMFFSRCHMPLK
jgi:hypothetical protein